MKILPYASLYTGNQYRFKQPQPTEKLFAGQADFVASSDMVGADPRTEVGFRMRDRSLKATSVAVVLDPSFR